MTVLQLLAIIIFVSVVGYFFAASKAKSLAKKSAAQIAGQGSGRLPSRTNHYGAFAFVWGLLPACLLLAVWSVAQPRIIDQSVLSSFPADVLENEATTSLSRGVVSSVAKGLRHLSNEDRNLVRDDTETMAAVLKTKGIALAGEVEPYILQAAETLNSSQDTFVFWRTIVTSLLSVGGVAFALWQISPTMRARGKVETVLRCVLLAAASIAILTTLGIVLSLLSETLSFFAVVPPSEFFFGTVWDPRFAAADAEGNTAGQFGLLPLVWGTLYISFIALLIAVPIGLFAAIYMAEYASPRARSIAKPLLEVLAGIPTIVYGFFALVTVGPLIRDAFAIPLELGASASNVMTAGMVLGIMIIPFISSLSDDIINAVPQALRDGSYAMGATKSETIKLVVLPAALPGVVGSVLLAASRAIGETMIVVLAAGVATRISLNPFEEMTTVTVKIVSQLTGDLEFTSPQTQVAFALGITLFVVTLGLNVLALHIVRKYQEQYE